MSRAIANTYIANHEGVGKIAVGALRGTSLLLGVAATVFFIASALFPLIGDNYRWMMWAAIGFSAFTAIVTWGLDSLADQKERTYSVCKVFSSMKGQHLVGEGELAPQDRRFVSDYIDAEKRVKTHAASTVEVGDVVRRYDLACSTTARALIARRFAKDPTTLVDPFREIQNQLRAAKEALVASGDCTAYTTRLKELQEEALRSGDCLLLGKALPMRKVVSLRTKPFDASNLGNVFHSHASPHSLREYPVDAIQMAFERFKEKDVAVHNALLSQKKKISPEHATFRDFTVYCDERDALEKSQLDLFALKAKLAQKPASRSLKALWKKKGETTALNQMMVEILVRSFLKVLLQKKHLPLTPTLFAFKETLLKMKRNPGTEVQEVLILGYRHLPDFAQLFQAFVKEERKGKVVFENDRATLAEKLLPFCQQDVPQALSDFNHARFADLVVTGDYLARIEYMQGLQVKMEEWIKKTLAVVPLRAMVCVLLERTNQRESVGFRDWLKEADSKQLISILTQLLEMVEGNSQGKLALEEFRKQEGIDELLALGNAVVALCKPSQRLVELKQSLAIHYKDYLKTFENCVVALGRDMSDTSAQSLPAADLEKLLEIHKALDQLRKLNETIPATFAKHERAHKVLREALPPLMNKFHYKISPSAEATPQPGLWSRLWKGVEPRKFAPDLALPKVKLAVCYKNHFQSFKNCVVALERDMRGSADLAKLPEIHVILEQLRELNKTIPITFAQHDALHKVLRESLLPLMRKFHYKVAQDAALQTGEWSHLWKDVDPKKLAVRINPLAYKLYANELGIDPTQAVLSSVHRQMQPLDQKIVREQKFARYGTWIAMIVMLVVQSVFDDPWVIFGAMCASIGIQGVSYLMGRRIETLEKDKKALKIEEFLLNQKKTAPFFRSFGFQRKTGLAGDLATNPLLEFRRLALQAAHGQVTLS